MQQNGEAHEFSLQKELSLAETMQNTVMIHVRIRSDVADRKRLKSGNIEARAFVYGTLIPTYTSFFSLEDFFSPLFLLCDNNALCQPT